MNGWRIGSSVLVEEHPKDLDHAFGREVKWMQGFRVNLDSRLLLLGLRRMLSQGDLREADLRTSEYVLGCRLGAMESYEKFDDSLATSTPAPLAFAYSLPSMPLACASVCYGLRGQTYTVVGRGDVGVRALHRGVGLIAAGRAKRVVVGCWETPSNTANRDRELPRCRLLLALIEAADELGQGGRPVIRAGESDGDDDCVEVLSNYLKKFALPCEAKVGHG